MNEILISYGKLSIKNYDIRIDELKLYYDNSYIDLSKDKIDELLNILVLFKDNDYNLNHIDSIDYDIFVIINGEETRYLGNNSSNLSKIKYWLGGLNVR